VVAGAVAGELAVDGVETVARDFNTVATDVVIAGAVAGELAVDGVVAVGKDLQRDANAASTAINQDIKTGQQIAKDIESSVLKEYLISKTIWDQHPKIYLASK